MTTSIKTIEHRGDQAARRAQRDAVDDGRANHPGRFAILGATSGAKHRHAREHTAAFGALRLHTRPTAEYARSGSHRRLCGRMEGSGYEAHEA